ncbi:MAG TPA: hypothetical protein VMW73_09755 [Spirochaetia bacterium]|nr:hypothetical protein [Spirochaetia bacterium]
MARATESFDFGFLIGPARWLLLIAGIAIILVFWAVGYNYGSTYYLYLPTALVPLSGYLALRRGAQAYRARARVARQWGRTPPTDRKEMSDVGLEAYFSSFVSAAQPAIDPRTWKDLGLSTLYEEMDTCYSAAGRNELYALLRSCLPEPASMVERDTAITLLRQDEEFRVRLLSELALLDDHPDRDCSVLLSEDSPGRDPLQPMFVLLGLGALASVFAPVFLGLGTGFILLFAVFGVNMWVYFRKARHISGYIPALRSLDTIVRQAIRVCRLTPPAQLDSLERMRPLVAELLPLARTFRWILTGSSAGVASLSGDLAESVFMYIKIFFQIDLIIFGRLIRGIEGKRSQLKALYRAMGRLDALQAVASFRERRELDTAPESTEELALTIEEMYHPLIEDAVANSIDIARPGALITGTNMAGKSTFLRTVGLNVVLAQTIGASFSGSYRGGRFLIMSSIEKSDHLDSGKSFYYDEAERIFRMIERVGGEVPVLLLIDELLSGTNSIEREGASVAILRYLAQRHALTIAATHDVGIANRVVELYAPYYFTDHAGKRGLNFDYRMRPGIVRSRNAIRLLSLIGYPQDLVNEALSESGGENVDEQSGETTRD